MSRRYRAISRVQLRVEQVANLWAEAAEIIREAAQRPDYRGPSPQSVERIGVEIAATREAVQTWLAATATAPRRRKLDATMRRALAAAVQAAEDGAAD